MKLNKLIILVAEDDENDVALLRRAISKVVHSHKIQVVSDGEQAIDYLRGEGVYSDRESFPFPNILILDIKMPRKSGLEVLEWLNQHPQCGIIPSVIFSSSDQPQDISRAYNNRANAYFIKPLSFNEWVELMEVIFGYWCRSHVPEPPPRKKCE